MSCGSPLAGGGTSCMPDADAGMATGVADSRLCGSKKATAGERTENRAGIAEDNMWNSAAGALSVPALRHLIAEGEEPGDFRVSSGAV